MAIVSYWSYGKKETGQTLSMAATMISMGADHNFKILGVSRISRQYIGRSIF